jgi:hypothetical protein
MSAASEDVGAATEAYAAYLNAPRGVLDDEEQELFDEDLARARAAMERAWLEAKPVHGDALSAPCSPTGSVVAKRDSRQVVRWTGGSYTSVVFSTTVGDSRHTRRWKSST